MYSVMFKDVHGDGCKVKDCLGLELIHLLGTGLGVGVSLLFFHSSFVVIHPKLFPFCVHL